MTPHRFSSLLLSLTQRLAFREWLLLTCLLTLAAFGLGWQNGLGRADQSMYDLLLSANGRAARSDIIIVAIDDYSISQLGRWPWPRQLHAQLLQQILPAHPRRVGLDVILTEPEKTSLGTTNDSGDRALSTALRAQDSVLPVISTNTGAGLVMLPPIPMLACAAAALGHINLQLDSDGVLRSFTPYKTDGTQRWPHFALAMSQPLPAKSEHCEPTGTHATLVPAINSSTNPIRIAFSGGSGHFKSVPYVSVLRGEVPAQFFHDKYVLVGATALGMADSYPTPVSGLNGAMSGIEINANILAGLLDHKTIATAAGWQTALFCSVPVLLALLGYLLLSPRLSLLCTLLLIPTTLAFSWMLLRIGVWLPPAAALVVLLLSYPLWSWRRLEAAIAYLGKEFVRLEREPHLLPETAATIPDHERPLQDLLERRIRAMRSAARRVRDLRQFVSDSLNSFPDVALVTTPNGSILLLNRHANSYLKEQDIHGLDHTILAQLFGKLSSLQAVNQAANQRFRWPDLLDLNR
ncbi:MAG: CHASE2 domain-containing protein, partial [Herbaspirillum sp.]